MSKAPNYDGEYPGAGEKIGPLWQELWDAMRDGRWYRASTLAEVYAKEVAPSTVRSVLQKAADKGAIERVAGKGRYKTAPKSYRRIDEDVTSNV